MPTGFGQDVTALIGVAAGDIGMRALHHQVMQLSQVGLRQRRPAARQCSYIADRPIEVDRFEMVLERLAADRDPLLDDERRLGGAERVPLDRVRSVGQVEIVNVLEIAKSGAHHGTQPVKVRLLRGDPRHEVVHTLFLSQTEHPLRDPSRISHTSGS